jgi:hypothetical protein
VAESTLEEETPKVFDGLVACYLFNERNGNLIADSSGSSTRLNLRIPERIQAPKHPYLYVGPTSQFQHLKFYLDAILNVMIFVPIGFLLHFTLRGRLGLSPKTSAFVLIIQ